MHQLEEAGKLEKIGENAIYHIAKIRIGPRCYSTDAQVERLT